MANIKVFVLLEKNGDKTRVVDVYRNEGAAQIRMTELNAAKGLSLYWIEGKRIVGPGQS